MCSDVTSKRLISHVRMYAKGLLSFLCILIKGEMTVREVESGVDPGDLLLVQFHPKPPSMLCSFVASSPFDLCMCSLLVSI